jgi:hypothetical protein
VDNLLLLCPVSIFCPSQKEKHMQTMNKAVVVVLLCIGGISLAVPIVAQDGSGRMFLPFMKVEAPAGGGAVVKSENLASFMGENMRPPADIVRLPLYTEEDLTQVRGLPVNPGDPDTFYLPPGIPSLDQLPICPLRTEDDPTTPEVNEGYEEYLRTLYDGTAERNSQSRVVLCRIGLDLEGGVSMPPDEFHKWWLENGQPISPDPRTE